MSVADGFWFEFGRFLGGLAVLGSILIGFVAICFLAALVGVVRQGRQH